MTPSIKTLRILEVKFRHNSIKYDILPDKVGREFSHNDPLAPNESSAITRIGFLRINVVM